MHKFSIVSRENVEKNVLFLNLEQIRGPRLFYHPGQYTTIHFDNISTKLSLSFYKNTPSHFTQYSFYVKTNSSFVSSLLNENEIVYLDSATGKCNLQGQMSSKKIVIVTHGIGIVPAISILFQKYFDNLALHIEIIWIKKADEYMYFHDQILTIKEMCQNVSCNYYSDRISFVDYVQEKASNFDSTFYLYGSRGFVFEVAERLISRGTEIAKIFSDNISFADLSKEYIEE